MGREFTVKVGDVEVPCLLPLMPTRLALVDAVNGANALPEAQQDFVRVLALVACLAASMKVAPQCGGLVRFRGDAVALGEAAADELCGGDPARMSDLVRAGGDCFAALWESIPKQAEVTAAANPTAAPAAPSTGAT